MFFALEYKIIKKIISMPSLANKILHDIHDVSIYENFDYQSYTSDLSGGEVLPIFKELIDHLKPKVVVEVGSWKGRTATHMASLLKQQNLDAVVICVDTWLGGLEHFTRFKNHLAWGLNKYKKHGYPNLYYQFLSNVMQAEMEDYIVPLPTTSNIGAKWLKLNNIKPDLVFIDASHEEDDVYQDLNNYWDLLAEGGFMFGDDWHPQWHGVISAIKRFAKERNLPARINNDIWLFEKKSTN